MGHEHKIATRAMLLAMLQVTILAMLLAMEQQEVEEVEAEAEAEEVEATVGAEMEMVVLTVEPLKEEMKISALKTGYVLIGQNAA